jgi:hypothetical protein
MTDTATVADKFKLAFYEAARDLMAADIDTQYVYVTFGAPGTYDPEDLVSFLDIASEQETATIGNRSREETLTLTVAISCFRGGGQDSELVASARAYDILRRLEQYVRKTDTTLGGVVRHCFLVGHDSTGATDPASIDKGRVIEIMARFRAVARIT